MSQKIPSDIRSKLQSVKLCISLRKLSLNCWEAVAGAQLCVSFCFFFYFVRISSLVVLGYCTSIVNLTLKAMKCMLHHLPKLGGYSWRLQHNQMIIIGSRSLLSIMTSHVCDVFTEPAWMVNLWKRKPRWNMEIVFSGGITITSE